jgi:hypothetical protein
MTETDTISGFFRKMQCAFLIKNKPTFQICILGLKIKVLETFDFTTCYPPENSQNQASYSQNAVRR